MNDKERESNTSFNMSLSTLERIDILLRSVSQYMIIGHGVYVQRNIMALYKELYPFLNDTEKKDSKKVFDRIRFGVQIVDKHSFRMGEGIYTTMIEFDFWIRDKLFEKGLLMAKSDNPENALSSM